MTRVTNFGRKRTYVETGIGHQADPETMNELQPDHKTNVEPMAEASTTEAVAPPKKKRKRTKMSKRDGNMPVIAAIASGGDEADNKNVDMGEKGEECASETATPKPALSKSAKKKKREKERKAKNLSASEVRRQRRINEKMAGTTCFACRETGHAAKDCPVTKNMVNNGEGSAKKSKGVVGICYRCGSTRHTLSRCKKSINDVDPLPFASCFVCNGKGHLASSCPQNKAKGVYPNGGCCKLCGDTSHLARDCGLRKRDVIDNSSVLGTGREAGADEDDFHTFKRHTTELEQGEKQQDKVRRSLDIKAGAYSGVVKTFGNVLKPSTKKVVYF